MANKNPNTKGLVSGARDVPPLGADEVSTTVRIRGTKKKLKPFLDMTATERGVFVTQALEVQKGEDDATPKKQ